MKDWSNHFFKTSDGEQIFYSLNFNPKKTSSQILIFNYGLVCSHQHWQKQIEYFHKKNHPILLHDYRGHFQSSGKNKISSITFNQMATDLKELVDYLCLTNNIVIGHSMGVNISLEYAKIYPENLIKMILISGTTLPIHNIMLNTHLTGHLKKPLTQIFHQFPKEFKTFWRLGTWNPIIKKLIHQGGFNTSQVSDEFIEIYLNKISLLGPELFFQMIDQMHKHDILAFIEQIQTPTLVIGGNKDKVIPNFSQKLIHSQLKNAQIYTIHEGSHVPQVDFPEITNERINLFINN